MNPIVNIEGLGKRYRLRHQDGAGAAYGYSTLRDTLAATARAPLTWLTGGRRAARQREDFWALRDVSFAVAPGEVVGVIGRNGAGKSTLLKILSRITEPTTGRVTLHGRVASLLEVGTGFHPELTGRENIFLNGAILGMSRDEIRRKFDGIVAFAEVERFLDTPVKHYSSGMYVRLAFGVAAHLEPDVLIVDEVLAVGDAEFQKRSLGKMRDVSRGGRTVLFVSHNMAAVQALCSRSVWLERGQVAFDGATADAVGRYLADGARHGLVTPDRALPLGDALELRRFEVSPAPVPSGGAADVMLEIAARHDTRITELAVLVYSAQEIRVAILDLRDAGLPATIAAGQPWRWRGTISAVPLVEGDYQVGLGMRSTTFIGDRLGLATLSVSARPRAGQPPYPAAHRGFVELDFRRHP